MGVRRDEHEDWTIGLEKQYVHQVVTVQLFHRGSLPFKRRELLGTGKLPVSRNQRPVNASIPLMQTYS